VTDLWTMDLWLGPVSLLWYVLLALLCDLLFGKRPTT